MCGIIGLFNESSTKVETKLDSALKALHARGRDGSAKSILKSGKVALGHTLHAVVNNVMQPLQTSSGATITANCEIYNWETLNKKYGFNSKNDADVLLKILDQKGLSALDELDGVYALVFYKNGKVIIARDIIGVKPVWYSHQGGDGGFAVCSEKKVLEKLGYATITELNPRKALEYDIASNKLKFIEREFLKTEPLLKDATPEKVRELIELAIKKRIPNQKVGILFSGGVDSTLIALLLQKMGVDFVCYTTAAIYEGMKEPADLTAARLAAKEHGFELKEVILSIKDIQNRLPKLIPLIEDTNVVKVGVALTLDAACKAAADDGCKVVFSGLGSEELFAGYQRHRESSNLNKECLAGLRKIYERDLYRDDVISMNNSVELRLPFLDKELAEYSLRIPSEMKIKNGIEKYILRQVSEQLGVYTAWRKKKAAQYGSNVHKMLLKLAKKADCARISEYMLKNYPERQLRLAALMSTGKDSHYALHTMVKQNYDVVCLITLQSENKDSYMFHTPAIELAGLQAEAMGLPLIVHKTRGEKEKELEDLELAIKKAVEQHNVEGIITGALYSTYQRDRIEKICEKLGIKVFSPLWHIDQETEVRDILSSGFEVWLSSVACDGLNKDWLGHPLTTADVDKLALLNQKIGINVAGEGGEYESLVLDGPLFSKRIKLVGFEIENESEHVARLIVKKAKLIDA